MTSIPNLRNAYRAVEAAPESDHRTLILDSLRSVIDFCECALPHGDVQWVEGIAANIVHFAERSRWMDATVAAVNLRFDLAAQADEKYVSDEDEPHGVRMPMGGGE